jgi:CHAD domain-containing protein
VVVDQVVEREDKYEVPEGFVLPDLEELLPEGGRLERADHHLENTYFDTPSAHLAQFGITLRQRQGGPDAGWHLKVPDDDARVEISDSSQAEALPTSLLRLVAGVRAGEDVAPVAQVSVERSVVRLLSRKGSALVEVADDRVSGTTMGSEARLSSWREIEVELKSEDAHQLQERLGQRLVAAGARPSGYGSKLRRTLGFPPDAPSAPDPATVGGQAWSYVAAQCREVVRCDVRLRLDEPLVHKFRVAIRRLRSTLRVFDPLFEPEASAALERELVWFAGLLGEVRDREVLLERLAVQVKELPAEVVLGAVAAHIETTLLRERAEHRARVAEAMAGDRYAGLMQLVLLWQTRPPLTPRADQPVADAKRYLERAEKKVSKRLAEADGDIEALHDARKAAKRYRYAAELAAQAGGKKASRIVKSTTELQTLLGEHQDSVVSAAFLRRLGAEAGADGAQNGFTYGFLMALEWRRAEQIRDEAGRRWGRGAKQ